MKRGKENTLKIKAIAPWFGGKRTLAPEIVRAIGTHTAYWEPFCGSMAVLFAKPESPSETVCDLHRDVTNLARVVASDQGPDLFDRLQRTAFSESLFAECREQLQTDLEPIDRAYCFFVEAWMGRNGVAGTRSSNTAFCVRYTSNGGDPAIRFASAVNSIPDWARRLRGVTILNRDGFEVLERIEDKGGTAIYCDPPYLVKGAKYLHDFANNDHKRLADLLKRFRRTRVVVSYYDHPELESLYGGNWSKQHLKASKAMVSSGMRDSKGTVEAPEVLLINTPPGLFEAA